MGKRVLFSSSVACLMVCLRPSPLFRGLAARMKESSHGVMRAYGRCTADSSPHYITPAPPSLSGHACCHACACRYVTNTNIKFILLLDDEQAVKDEQLQKVGLGGRCVVPPPRPPFAPKTTHSNTDRSPNPHAHAHERHPAANQPARRCSGGCMRCMWTPSPTPSTRWACPSARSASRRSSRPSPAHTPSRSAAATGASSREARRRCASAYGS